MMIRIKTSTTILTYGVPMTVLRLEIVLFN